MIDIEKVKEELQNAINEYGMDYYADNHFPLTNEALTELDRLQKKEVVKKYRDEQHKKWSDTFPDWAKYEDTPLMEYDLYNHAEGVLDAIIAEIKGQIKMITKEQALTAIKEVKDYAIQEYSLVCDLQDQVNTLTYYIIESEAKEKELEELKKQISIFKNAVKHSNIEVYIDGNITGWCFKSNDPEGFVPENV